VWKRGTYPYSNTRRLATTTKKTVRKVQSPWQVTILPEIFCRKFVLIIRLVKFCQQFCFGRIVWIQVFKTQSWAEKESVGKVGSNSSLRPIHQQCQQQHVQAPVIHKSVGLFTAVRPHTTAQSLWLEIKVSPLGVCRQYVMVWPWSLLSHRNVCLLRKLACRWTSLFAAVQFLVKMCLVKMHPMLAYKISVLVTMCQSASDNVHFRRACWAISFARHWIIITKI
jgi:hypothetical protein